MGTKARYITLVPAVSLEELVPDDHFYRHLGRQLDLSFVRALVQDCYAGNGRPSVDPMVLFKLQLVHAATAHPLLTGFQTVSHSK